MKYGVFLRTYKGLHTVEYSSPSVGCTLFTSYEKSQVEAEQQKFAAMSEQEIMDFLSRKEKAR
jgi:hypothetical protein